MQRFMITAGIVLIALGIGWPWLSRFPFGRLPGDISIVREGFHFYFPITTSLLISVVVTVLFWLVKR